MSNNYNDKNIEKILLNKADYEDEMARDLEDEIAQAKTRIDKIPEIITDQKLVSVEAMWDINTIYKVYNRKQKTESFIRGDQAESLIKYTDDYVIRFDHRIEYR